MEERRQLKLLVTNQQIKESYSIEVENRYEVLRSEESLEDEEELDKRLENPWNSPKRNNK